MKPSMKVNLVLAIALSLASAGARAADPSSTATAISSPKNLARQHLGANLLVYSSASQSYVPTEAAAAWLDDDIATGWPAQTGEQYYLLALPEPQLINGFGISARSASGTVTLYAGDEAAPPTAKSWSVLEKDVPVESLNEQSGKSFGRYAKYILIKTELTASGPWYSLYLYGDKAATAYHIQQRGQPVDPRTVFGPYTNPQTSFNLSSLYAHSHVTFAGGDASSWHQAIDDDPQTGVYVPTTKDDAGFVVRFDHSYPIQRISVLTEPSAKGKLEFFVINPVSADSRTTRNSSKGANASDYIRVSNQVAALSDPAPADAASQSPVDDSAVSVAGQQPVATMSFDGTNPRASVDFTPTPGSAVAARWTPDTAGQPLKVREINSFGDLALNDYELAPDSVSEGPVADNSAAQGGSGKETLPAVGEGGKESLPPVGEALPPKTPFLPGVPIFPPNIPVSP